MVAQARGLRTSQTRRFPPPWLVERSDACFIVRGPNCAAEYKLVRAEAGPPPDHQIECRRCGAPLQGREGKFILKYFLIGRGRTQAKAARGG